MVVRRISRFPRSMRLIWTTASPDSRARRSCVHSRSRRATRTFAPNLSSTASMPKIVYAIGQQGQNQSGKLG